jgi:exopolysaccharide biosynthesis operon protein EpsL
MRKRFSAKPPAFPSMAVALACAFAGGAQADSGDTLNFVLGSSLRYDDNLFRLPENQNPAAISGKSDRSERSVATYAGIRLDKAYSLQRFQLNATATAYRYQTYDQLDFTGREYTAAWLWSVTPRLTGVLAAERSERQTDFADFRGLTGENRQINESRRVQADWWATGGWHLLAGASTIDSTNDTAFTAVGSSRQDNTEYGLRYVSAADNSIALVRRDGRGEYTGRILDPTTQLDTGYDKSETELRAIWQASGKSNFDARLGHLERKHDHFPARDFSGNAGRVIYTWLPTGKLRVRLEALRDLVSFQESAHSYYISRYASLQPSWQVTAKTGLRLRLDMNKRDYRGPIIPVTELREDTIRTAQLGIDWRPWRALLLDAYVTREKRTSNLAGLDYRANIAGLTVEFRF